MIKRKDIFIETRRVERITLRFEIAASVPSEASTAKGGDVPRYKALATAISRSAALEMTAPDEKKHEEEKWEVYRRTK